MIIEIKVTHGVDEVKLSKIKELNISALEIDLSHIDREVNFDILTEIIVNSIEHKRWLYHRKQTSVYMKLQHYSKFRRSIQRGFAHHIDKCPIQESG